MKDNYGRKIVISTISFNQIDVFLKTHENSYIAIYHILWIINYVDFYKHWEKLYSFGNPMKDPLQNEACIFYLF